MSQSRGKKWFKKAEYKTPREAFDPGDGSLVEVVQEAYKDCPFAIKITRVWPDGRVSTIYRDPPREGLNPDWKDLFVDDPLPKTQAAEFQAALANGTYRPPYLQLASVPGNKPGDNFDSATNQIFETRERYKKYYEQNHLEKVPANDSILDRNLPGKYTGNAQQYDPSKPPPVPKEFQGVKFYYGNNS